ncbi:MAG: hypothetical protein CL816_01200 [Coxiellaceae bacterium]|nr:hypothetical protein [Coxiellaceae bacterium]|tara:strand:- start:4931 stop:5593 length:663 start_codon:yes stop_codon:yes gene_type:complete
MQQSKHTFIAAILCVATSTCFAGGDEYMAESNSFARHAYLEVMGGYADTAWENTTGTQLSSTMTLDYTKNDNGGLVWGGGIGYQWAPWVAAELGAFMLPTTEASIQFNGNTVASGDIKGSIIYLAGKLSHPVKEHISLFTKAGVNYQDTNADDAFKSGSNGINSNTYFGPFFGVGMSYSLKSNFYAKLEYDRASGQANHSDDEYAPNPNIFVAGLGYTFG